MSDEPIKPGLAAAEAATQLPEEVYTTRDAMDILVDDRPEPEEIWGGLHLVPGQIMEVIGGSGLGKSRMMLNLAVCQILGRPFADLPTLQRPLTWLFYGNENSFFRFRYDLKKMVSILKTEDREKLKGKIWLPTMENANDAFVSFCDKRNREKLMATMRQRKPDVLVLDPWGSFIDGDELSDGDVRRTITEIMEILAANGKDKPAVAIVLNHSRNGIAEMVKAAGPDRANYGKNSKAIFSVVRCVWNLRAAEFDEPVTKIELIHAKCSDRRPYDPRAVVLNEKNFHYKVDTTFNHDVWQSYLEKKYRSGSMMTTEARESAQDAAFKEACDKTVAYVDSLKLPIKKPELDKWMKIHVISKERCPEVFNALMADHKLAAAKRRMTSEKFVWTPEKMLGFLQNAKPGEYISDVITPPSGNEGEGGANEVTGEFALESPDSH